MPDHWFYTMVFVVAAVTCIGFGFLITHIEEWDRDPPATRHYSYERDKYGNCYAFVTSGSGSDLMSSVDCKKVGM